MRINDLFSFIKKRHDVYLLKVSGESKPWSPDKILQQYRFCNVYRELDTQTKWFSDNWRKRYEDDQDLWFASLMFRFINWSDTADLIWRPLPWNPIMFTDAIHEQERLGKKVYSSAYMITTHSKKEKKSTYIANSLTVIWSARKELRYTPWESLDVFHKRLTEQYGVGSFMAAQVVADCKYAGKMKMADDWWSFCASGPGSRRGLNRVLNQHANVKWSEEDWRAVMVDLQHQIDPLIFAARMPRLHSQDLQNCLCEFDKYERIRLGEGRLKQRYNGERDEGN